MDSWSLDRQCLWGEKNENFLGCGCSPRARGQPCCCCELGTSPRAHPEPLLPWGQAARSLPGICEQYILSLTEGPGAVPEIQPLIINPATGKEEV